MKNNNAIGASEAFATGFGIHLYDMIYGKSPLQRTGYDFPRHLTRI
ncbi:MAG: hypothetical protein K2H14_08220 [Muribaculaceae bacterium]|nr:hypothetical protein [Muribaculaceae bacterium]